MSNFYEYSLILSFPQHVTHHAPIKLLKLEFAVPEDKFEAVIGKAEEALQQQQEQIKRSQNVKEALIKHRVSICNPV